MTITLSAPSSVDLKTLKGSIGVTFDDQPFYLVDPESYKELLRAKHNLEYLNMLAQSHEQYKKGQVVVKTMEELEAISGGFVF